MKKIVISVVAAVLIAASVFGIFAVKDKMFFKNHSVINEKSSLNEVIEFYSESVKKSKDHKNFNLEVTTSISLDEINSPNIFLNEVLPTIIGYQVGDEREETKSFSFKNGVDINNSSVTPFGVIQPSNSYIEEFSAESLLLKSVSCTNKYTSISFEAEKETADLDDVISAINPIIQGFGSADKLAVTALAPKHSAFINIGDVLSTVVDMLGISEIVNNSGSENKETASDSKSISVGVNGGKCSIGETEFSADIDENENMSSVKITVPVELDADFKFMNSNIEASICVTVVQTYSFSYSD